jgi:hypothetical protein
MPSAGGLKNGNPGLNFWGHDHGQDKFGKGGSNVKRAIYVVEILIGLTLVGSGALGQSQEDSRPVTGTGTPGQIPVWVGTRRLGNSLITQVSGGIQVSSTSTPITGSTSGTTGGAVGVAGFANGNSGFVAGVQGITNSPQGVGGFFVNNSQTGFASGVFALTKAPGSAVNGLTFNPGGIGISGGSPNVAVSGISQDCSHFPPCVSSPGIAGQFVTGSGGLILQGLLRSPTGDSFTQQFSLDSSGNLAIAGNLTKGSGSFKIDHPLDPANKYLSHSFVESPDMKNIYDGTVTTNEHGLATVVLPEYFEALNRDFRYQLTVIGQFAQAIVKKEIEKNRFTIRTNKPAVKVSWQVTGIRRDAYANAHRIAVEDEKPPQERGHYLHPELFGASEEQAIGATHIQPPPPPPVLEGLSGTTAR